MKITFESKLWKYQGKAAWYFVTLPQEESLQIKFANIFSRRGFGSIRVKAKILNQEWQTSIFPDSKTKSYLLPIKSEIRKKVNLKDDSLITVTIDMVI